MHLNAEHCRKNPIIELGMAGLVGEHGKTRFLFARTSVRVTACKRIKGSVGFATQYARHIQDAEMRT